MSVNGSTDRDPGRDDDDVVVRKGENGWVVGGENVSDLTSAMVLADLFAADQATSDAPGPESAEGQGNSSPEPAAASPAPGPAAAGRAAGGRGQAGPSVPDDPTEAVEADRLAVTVAQLEHALASRVRVEQAIGVLAERHRMRPRDAFDLLRRAARSRGRRVTEIAQDVVASAANPLLRLPEELSRKLPEQRPRGRSMRRGGRHAQRA
jgi:ANTAR domain-containing protein